MHEEWSKIKVLTRKDIKRFGLESESKIEKHLGHFAVALSQTILVQRQ